MVPSTFTPPDVVETQEFLVRPILAADAEADFDAFITSIEHLHGIFGPDSEWPRPDMTLEENVLDLAWHQREHESASCFCYTVFDPSNTRCLGAIYFGPARKAPYEVEAFYWIRASEVALEATLGDFVRHWLADAWPFESVIYPGRNMSWDEWKTLPDHQHW